MRFRLDRALLTGLAILALDQWTKWIAFKELSPGEQVAVLPGVEFGHTENNGIAFGAFAGRPMIVYSLMVVALCVLLWFYFKHRRRAGLWLATGLLLGGALGNALDRIRLGYVRDFIELPHFPSFNVADVAITAGVILLVMTIEKSDGEEPVAENHAAGEQAIDEDA